MPTTQRTAKLLNGSTAVFTFTLLRVFFHFPWRTMCSSSSSTTFAQTSPRTAPTVGIELYDHAGDLGADLDAAAPDVNLAGVARHEATRRALSGVLRAHFRRH